MRKKDVQFRSQPLLLGPYWVSRSGFPKEPIGVGIGPGEELQQGQSALTR
jgi:hypothetical protein